MFTFCATHNHYSGIIMNAMLSQITSVWIIYWTICSGADRRKPQSSASLAFVKGIHQWLVNSPVTGESPTQRASNMKNASIWWRYHVVIILQASYVNSWTTLSSLYVIKWCIPAFNQTLSSCDWKLVTEVPRSQEKNSPKRQTKIQHKIHAQNQWY